MKQDVTVRVTNKNGNRCEVLTARELSVRQKILNVLFGKKSKVLVITPNESVNQITISEN